MRFLVDESTDPAVASWLSQQGHEVFSVCTEARGMDNDDVIHKAFTENWILIPNDKDFREKVYREQGSVRSCLVINRVDRDKSLSLTNPKFKHHMKRKLPELIIEIAKPCMTNQNMLILK